jgi:hypothetical protein
VSGPNDKNEKCIRVLKQKNIDAGCCKPEGNGSSKCPNVFAVCRTRTVPLNDDPELVAVTKALENTEVVDG